MAATRLEPAGHDADSGLLSVHQVAQRLGCSVSLVQKWRRLGWLPAARLGTADVAVYGYRLEDVERFAAARWNRRRGRPPKAADTVEQANRAPRADHHAVAPRATSASPAPAGAGALGQPAHVGPAAALRPAAPETSIPANSGTRPSGGTQAESNRAKAGATTPAATATEVERASPGQPGQPAFPAVPRDRPLVLWDGDPREQRVLLLARFTPEQEAERIADLWSRRYDTLTLGESKGAGGRPVIYAIWRDGRRVS